MHGFESACGTYAERVSTQGPLRTSGSVGKTGAERLSRKPPETLAFVRLLRDNGHHGGSTGGTVGYNFVPCARDQQFLMPPSLDEWLPRGLPDDRLSPGRDAAGRAG
jgi:hypothetical protein